MILKSLWSKSLLARRTPKRYWQNPQHCKQFFEEFAADHGFDPLDPESWYHAHFNLMLGKRVQLASQHKALHHSNKRNAQGGYNIKEYYGGFKKALQLAFTDLQFSKWNRLDEF